MKNDVTRRGFLRRSASMSALGLAAGFPAGAVTHADNPARVTPGPPPRESQTASVSRAASDDDAHVAPQYRGFLKKSLHELPTPALLIDLDIFEKNIQTMVNYVKSKSIAVRPHGKAHKSP